MKNSFTKLFLLLLLGLFIVAGCVRQSGGPAVASLDALAGSYRIMWSDGEPNDHIFNLEQKNGMWHMADDEDSVPMTTLTPEEIESIFGKEMAGNAQCLEAVAEASTIIICVTKPGTATEVRIDDWVSYSSNFTSKTGYVAYIGHMGIWDLEKIR